MILLWLIVLLIGGGMLAWMAGRAGGAAAFWVALATTALGLALALRLWAQFLPGLRLAAEGRWLVEWRHEWIPQFGISLHLALDGLSLLLVVLTMALGVISVLISWGEVHHRQGFYYFNLLWVLAGITGVFLSLDLFLFYFFWELMLIPMALLIVVWGYERRVYAAIKFFIFTQLSGLLMLIAIVALVLLHAARTGVTTFEYTALLGTPLSERAGFWLMLGFFIAFAVKLPAIPVHVWLPDAHTEAPTAGSVILAGLLLKTGAYGLLRFVLPLFPAAAAAFAPTAMLLAVAGILYGAVMAFGQTDLKRLVAYTSVSHMGFVLLGVFAFNAMALQGAVLVIVAHAFSTGALFITVGAIQHRIHTRDLAAMGGFWAIAPRLGGVGLFFALASLGLPGLGNFVAEFLVLAGAFQASVRAASWAALGLVLAAVYSLWIVQRVFHGVPHVHTRFKDLSPREMLVMAAMIAALLWLGLRPQAVLDTSLPAMKNVSAAIQRLHPPPAAKVKQITALISGDHSQPDTVDIVTTMGKEVRSTLECGSLLPLFFRRDQCVEHYKAAASCRTPKTSSPLLNMPGPQSAIRNPQSSIPHSAFRIPHLINPDSALRAPRLPREAPTP